MGHRLKAKDFFAYHPLPITPHPLFYFLICRVRPLAPEAIKIVAPIAMPIPRTIRKAMNHWFSSLFHQDSSWKVLEAGRASSEEEISWRGSGEDGFREVWEQAEETIRNITAVNKATDLLLIHKIIWNFFRNVASKCLTFCKTIDFTGIMGLNNWREGGDNGWGREAF